MYEEIKSTRRQMLDLEPGQQMVVCDAKRATLQNYASTIKEVTGRVFRVHKTAAPCCFVVVRHV